MWCKSLEVLNPYEALKEATMPDLKPCPFCGGNVRRVIGFGGLNFFKCRKCGAVVSFGNDFYNTHKDRAVEAWNRRARGGQA